MKVSIITVVRNNQATIAQSIDSVLSQDYPDIEYIAIDGNSTDCTTAIAQSYGKKITQLVSEPDLGMYDAMNKGLNLATGDIVGFLNSDDFYANSSVISHIVRQFYQQQVDLVFGDIVFVHPHNSQKVIRYYSSANFHPELFRWGWMPAHPSCFIKRRVYQEYGSFSTDYQLAADYELLLRFMAIHRLSYSYLPQVLVKMRPSGASNRNLACRWISNLEVLKACREHGISTNFFQLLARYPAKILEKFFIPSLPKNQTSSPSPVYEHSRN